MRFLLRSLAVPSCTLVLAMSSLSPIAAFAQSDSAATPQAGASEATLAIGGLIQAQFEDGDRGDARFPASGEDRFFLRRARLNATGKFKEDFDFRVELDLAGSLSAATGLRAQLTDGYLNWSHYKSANVRIGQFKTPFGFEQLYGDPRLLTAERSLVNDRLTLSRQLGVQLWGNALDQRLSYAVGAFNGNGVNNDNGKFLWAGRLSVIPWKAGPASWAVGADGFTSEDTLLSLPDLGLDSTPATPDKDNLFTGKRHGFGVDSQLEVGRASLWVEYLRSRFEPTNARPAARFDADGWYVQGAWFLVPQRLQLVLKYETFDPRRDSANPANTEVSTDTVGLTYYVKGHDLKALINYLRTDLGGRTATQNKILLRFQVIF